MSCYVGLSLQNKHNYDDDKEHQASLKLSGNCSEGIQQTKKIYSGKSTQYLQELRESVAFEPWLAPSLTFSKTYKII